MANTNFDYSELQDPKFRKRLLDNPYMLAYYSQQAGKRQDDRVATQKERERFAFQEKQREGARAQIGSNYKRTKDWNEYVVARGYSKGAPPKTATLEDVKKADYYKRRKKEIEDKYGWSDTTTLDNVYAPDAAFNEETRKQAVKEGVEQREAMRDPEWEAYQAEQKRQTLSRWGKLAPQQIPPKASQVQNIPQDIQQEPKVQINPPMTPSPKPSISVTPPSEDEAAAARRYNVMDITRLESVLSEMNTRDKQRDLIVEKNPWLGGGFTAKLDIPSPVEAARREGSVVAPLKPRPANIPKSDVAKWAEDEAQAYAGSKIASEETMAAMRAQEPQDASKIPVTETPADKIPLSFREEPEPRVTPRTEQAYADEYKRRYQRALAGGYNTNSRDIYQ